MDSFQDNIGDKITLRAEGNRISSLYSAVFDVCLRHLILKTDIEVLMYCCCCFFFFFQVSQIQISFLFLNCLCLLNCYKEPWVLVPQEKQMKTKQNKKTQLPLPAYLGFHGSDHFRISKNSNIFQNYMRIER